MKEPTSQLVALAFGLAARIGRRFGLTKKQVAELIEAAYDITEEK